jgi:hypothetical protein
MKSLDRRAFVKGLAAGGALLALPRVNGKPAAPLPAMPSIGEPVLRSEDGLEHRVLRPMSALNPKNTEGSGIVLKDGRVLLLWTEFLDVDLMPAKDRPPHSPMRRSPYSDDGYARIVGAISADGGATWSEPRVYADDRDALVNTMSPALTRMADGRLLLAYSWRSGGNHPDNYGPTARRVRISDDEGQTWSEPVAVTPDDGRYHTGCHDRAWTLPSGRVLVQCHTNEPRTKPDGTRYYHKSTYIAYSDDNGRTWRRSNYLSENRGVGLNESCLARRHDGSLLMYLRSSVGRPFAAVSKDEGASWGPPELSPLAAPDAPTYLKRLPDSGNLLAIWNNNFNPAAAPKLALAAGPDGEVRKVTIPHHGLTRCPLLCAVSADDGRSWGLPLALEDDINYEWAYPGVVFTKDHALIHYFRSSVITRGRELMLTRVPLKWFERSLA